MYIECELLCEHCGLLQKVCVYSAKNEGIIVFEPQCPKAMHWKIEHDNIWALTRCKNCSKIISSYFTLDGKPVQDTTNLVFSNKQ